MSKKTGRHQRAEIGTPGDDGTAPNHRCSHCGGSLKGGAWKIVRPDGTADRLCYPCAWNPMLAPGPRVPVEKYPRRTVTEEEEGWEEGEDEERPPDLSSTTNIRPKA